MSPNHSSPGGHLPRLGLILLVGIAVVGIWAWRPGRRAVPPLPTNSTRVHGGLTDAAHPAHAIPTRLLLPTPGQTNLSAAEVVAGKVAALIRQRRELAQRFARHHGTSVPPEVNAFFDLAEDGSWEDLQEAYARLYRRREAGELPAGTARLFPVLLETFGVIETAHEWPAAALLEYGQAVVGSLAPGTVYLGGTDAGRFIPTLLNSTAGEPLVVLTHQTLADAAYLDYARFVHGDRLSGLTPEDSAEAFSAYVADAGRRWQHDRDFPNEPRQVRPGEQIDVLEDGRVQVGGQMAVVSINELFVRRLLEKNPQRPFALEEGYPFRSLYEDAGLTGPLLQLQGQSTQSPSGTGPGDSGSQRAVDYWQSTAERLLDDPQLGGTPKVRTAWARLALAQAGWLAEGEVTPAAEALFQVASRLSPASPEVVYRHLEFLADQERWEEARRVAEAAVAAAPDNESFRSLLDATRAHRKPGSP